MTSFPLHRFSEFAALSPAQASMLRSISKRSRTYAPRSVIRHEGTAAECMWLLHAGWVGASVDLPDAKRQMVKVHLPGDVLGSTSMCLVQAGDTLRALTDVVVSVLPFSVIGEMFASDPRLAATFLLSVQKERVTLKHRLAEIGRTSAYERMGGLLFDLLRRGRIAGIVGDDNVIICPLSQEHMANLLGLTLVHVNRMIRRLNEDGLIESSRSRFVIKDEGALEALVPFHPTFVTNPAWLPPPVC